MGIGGGIFLAAIGAVLVFGIDVDSVDVVNIDTIGVILMIAGLVMAVWSTLAGRGRTEARTTTTRSDGTIEQHHTEIEG